MIALHLLRPGWLFVAGLGVLLLGALVVALILIFAGIITGTGKPPANRAGADQPANQSLEVLKERYARGEITKDEYENMRNVLMT